MKRHQLNVTDEIALARLQPKAQEKFGDRSPGEWIRVLRGYFRMTQRDLAARAHISQPHLAGIESGRVDPQLSTLRRICDGLACDLVVEPRPRKPLKELLHGQARSVALARLKQTMGTMALENQAPDEELFEKLLERRTSEILNDKRERLWKTRNSKDV